MNSMTGFGRGSATLGSWLASVEISSVNRKQAEVVVQAPRELSELDSQIRKMILASVSRGRVQVSITISPAQASGQTLSINHSLAQAFFQTFTQLSESLGHSILPTAADFLRQPGLISSDISNLSPEEAWPAIESAITEALTCFNAMRAQEGGDLMNDFLHRIATLESFVETITTYAPTRPARQRETLLKRLEDANLSIDLSDDRILKEIALFADRCDISEEITRLGSHFAKFKHYLAANDATGRALDFLCQELFREFNTIGSKANDADIAQTIVEAKTELEKIREQVQNIE